MEIPQFVAWESWSVSKHTDSLKKSLTPSTTSPSMVATRLSFGKFHTNLEIAAAAQRLAEAVITIATRKCLCLTISPEYGTYLKQFMIRIKEFLNDWTCIGQKKKKITPFSRNHQGKHTKGWSTHSTTASRNLGLFFYNFSNGV